MSDDLISRAEAIKAIEDLQDCYNGFSDTYDKACIIGVLEELPSAEPRWIPVTERLPEESQDVLTVDNDGDYVINHIMEDDEWYWKPSPIAWTPLPQPWKGADE